MKGQRGCWHYRLNDYFFGKGYSESNKNTCPYFWGTLLAIGFAWIKYLVVPIANRWSSIQLPSLSYEQKGRIGKIVGWIIIGSIFIVTMFYGITVSWYNLGIGVLVFIGLAGGIIGLSFLAVLIKEKYDEWRFNHPKKNKKPKKPRKNIVKEQIGAWYHRHCPRLEWED